jgi:anti-anti-sigma regulatory factor
MSENPTADTQVYELPPVLDLPAARDLALRLQDALAASGSLILDAALVQRFTTPCLQVLASAALPDAEGRRAVTIRNLPDVMSDAVDMLGLSMALAIEGGE